MKHPVFTLALIVFNGLLCQNTDAIHREAKVQSLTPEVKIKGLRIVEKKVPVEYRETGDGKYPHAIIDGWYDSEAGWKLQWGRKTIALSKAGKFRLVVPLDAPRNYLYLIASNALESQHQEFVVIADAWDTPPTRDQQIGKKP